MNRIVREHYPVSQLPEDLQRQVDGQQLVTLTLDWDDDLGARRPEYVKSLEELFAFGAPTFGSLEAVAAYVHSLRTD